MTTFFEDKTIIELKLAMENEVNLKIKTSCEIKYKKFSKIFFLGIYDLLFQSNFLIFTSSHFPFQDTSG
jgi:hypothetical protein